MEGAIRVTAKFEVQDVVRPGSRRLVDARMYGPMKAASLKHTPTRPPGATLAEILKKVMPELPADLCPRGAKAGWWFKTVQLDLEAKGQLARTRGSPVRLIKTSK